MGADELGHLPRLIKVLELVFLRDVVGVDKRFAGVQFELAGEVGFRQEDFLRTEQQIDRANTSKTFLQ